MSVNLRNMVNHFGGDTKAIGRLVVRLGGYDEFARHYKEVDKQRNDQLIINAKCKDKNDVDYAEPPSVSGRLETKARNARMDEGASRADEAIKKHTGNLHAEVKKVLTNWFTLKEEISDLEKSATDSPEYVAGLIENVNKFITAAEQSKVTVASANKKDRDSLQQIDAAINRAKDEITSLGTRFEATSGPMSVTDQKMAPSAKDLAIYQDQEKSRKKGLDKKTNLPTKDERNRDGAGPTAQEKLDTVAGRLESMSVKGIKTENQAWALVGAEKKGQSELPANRLKALGRLDELNQKYGTTYVEPHLDSICDYIAGEKLATNYWLSKKPGANLDLNDQSAGTPLHKLLTEPSNKNFKNVWETGKSQASTELDRRGGVEERMGYGDALKRQYQSNNPEENRIRQPADTVKKKVSWTHKGKEKKGDVIGELDVKGVKNYSIRPDDGSADLLKPVTEVKVLDVFNVEKKGELPKYAALVDERQKDGVAPRYGDSFILWKASVRERVTHTPGDSWNTLEQGVKYFTSNKHPEVLIANADINLVRLAAAACTGQDDAWLNKVTNEGLGTDAYMETQIHGDLTWDDVDTVVVGGDDKEMLFTHFEQFKKIQGYKFTLKKK